MRAVVVLLSLGMMAAACTSLLGIEEIDAIGALTPDAAVTPSDASDGATDASAE